MSQVDNGWNVLSADEKDDVCELDLSSKKMEKIPQSVTMLQNLKELYLFGNEIVEIPLFITQLTVLRILNCAENQLSFIPAELSLLVNLNELWLHTNFLASVPGSLVNLTNLCLLSLCDNKKLPRHFQESITNDHVTTQSLLHQIALHQFQPLAARATLQWLLIWRHHLRHIPRDVANIIAHMIFNSRANTVWAM